jgi:hypothetical protein
MEKISRERLQDMVKLMMNDDAGRWGLNWTGSPRTQGSINQASKHQTINQIKQQASNESNSKQSIKSSSNQSTINQSINQTASKQ